MVTSCIRVVIAGSKLDHIRSIITTTTISDYKVVITRAKNNLTTNNYTIVNMDIKKVTKN